MQYEIKKGKNERKEKPGKCIIIFWEACYWIISPSVKRFSQGHICPLVVCRVMCVNNVIHFVRPKSTAQPSDSKCFLWHIFPLMGRREQCVSTMVRPIVDRTSGKKYNTAIIAPHTTMFSSHGTRHNEPSEMNSLSWIYTKWTFEQAFQTCGVASLSHL